MVKATNSNGSLQVIKDCYLKIMDHKVEFRILPEISDAKSASYSDVTVIGRSFPIKTYSHGDNRSIGLKLSFIVTESKDIQRNLQDFRAIASALYTRDDESPYRPPPICKFKCGKQLSDEELCVVIRNYSYNSPTNVAWDEETLLPYYFNVNITCEVVYPAVDLPGQDRIFTTGG